MNLLELESLRSELIEKTLNTSSNFLRLSLYQSYFDQILSFNNPNFSEAFLKEFIDDFIYYITKYEVWGTEPETTEKLLELLNNAANNNLFSEYRIRITTEIDRLKKQYENLILILGGKDFEDGKTHKAFFPLIDKEAPNNFYGIVESVTIRINRAVDSDNFIIIPSEKEIEVKIHEQCEISWLLALDLSQKYISKPFKFHEIIINFDKKIGFYEGNSLGIALTLSFLEQILKFYNPVFIINIKEKSAFTGGVDDKGIILTTGEEIVKQKVRTLFFSEVNNFVIPKTEETYAYFALTLLKQKFPERNLKLIPAEDINDVINRRDLIDIKKQKLVVRGGKFVKKNLVSAVITVLLAILFAYLFVIDWDDNPVSIISDGNKVYIKNARGKVLWNEDLRISEQFTDNKKYIDGYIKIVDINADNKNELLFIGNNSNRLKCINHEQKELWSYKFDDLVETKEQKLNNDYSIVIVDTITYDNQKSIYLISSNGPSFSSALYRISALDSKRLSGTLWAAGHFIDANILDYDNDGRNEIIGVGYDNGYEDLVFFICELDTLNTMRPTTNPYLLNNLRPARMEYYVRLPKTDYDLYYEKRTPHFLYGSFNYRADLKKFIFATDVNKPRSDLQVGYEIIPTKNVIDIVIGSSFRVIRDSLVAKGKLNPPYTDTEAYKEIMKNNILYWNDGKWVNRHGIEKK